MDTSVIFQVRFSEVSGLKQDAPVYFEKSEVGKVEKVTYTKEGDYLVEISIAPDFKNAATEDSKFFIENDPQKQQCKAVTIIQERPGGKVLKKNAVVLGSVKPGFLDEMLNGFKQSATVARFGIQDAVQQVEESLRTSSQKLDKEMAGALDDLSRQLQAFGTEVKKVPNKQEIQQFKETMHQFVDEFDRAQKDVRNHIRDELIPQLQKDLDRLRELLHNEDRDKEIDDIDKQVKKMSKV
ncbi:MAG: MlaD family protein [Pseudomonadota bacterium]